MDFYPIYSPPALIRVEHKDVVLCLTLGKQNPFLSHVCCPFAGLSAAQTWCCSMDRALVGRSLYGVEVTVLLSADRNGAALVITSRPQLLPRWSSRSLLREKLPDVQTSDLLESSPLPRQQSRGGPRCSPSCHSAGQKGHLQQGLKSWLSGLWGEAMLHFNPAVLVSISMCE